MVEEKCAIILVMILYLSTIQAFDLECDFGNESTSKLPFGSTINEYYQAYSSSDDFIECTNETHVDANTIPNSFFTSNAERLKTERVSNLVAYGNFNELLFESPLDWLSTLWIGSENLTMFNLSKYEGNSRLKKVYLAFSHVPVTVNLNSTQHLDDLCLYNIGVKFDCAALKASNLKILTTILSHLIGFNFSCLPQELEELQLLFRSYSSNYHGLTYIKNLTNLKTFNLEGNGITSFDLSNLPSSVTYLNLEYNNMQLLETVPLKGLFNLEVLNLRKNRLISFNLTNLPASVIELDLSYNNMQSLETIPLKGIFNLEVLNLTKTHLNSFNLTHLPASVIELDLSGNNMGSLETLPLKGLLNLKVLNLRNNFLNSFNLTNLPASVTEIDLSGNIMESLETLPLKGIRNLKTLKLTNNRFLDGNGLRSFNVKNLPASVTHLDLSYNHLKSFEVVNLPPNIKYLYLTDCNLTFDTSLFGTYKQLELLDLSGNKDVNGSSLDFYYGSNLKTLLFGSDFYNVDGAADPNTPEVPNTGDKILVNESVDNTTDSVDVGVGPTTSSSNNSTDNGDSKVDTDEDSCARHHVFIPLIVVICVGLFVTFL